MAINLAPAGYDPANLSNGGEVDWPAWDQWVNSFNCLRTTTLPLGPLRPTAVARRSNTSARSMRAKIPTMVRRPIRSTIRSTGVPAMTPAVRRAPTAKWPVLAGDYDRSGTVDNLDYAKWKTDFGITVAMPGDGADGNMNGRVDAADFTVWRNHVGATNAGAGGGGFASVATPNTDEEDSPQSFGFVLDLASTPQQGSGTAAMEMRTAATTVAVGTDRNLILWQLLGQATAAEVGDAPHDDLASGDDAAEVVDPAALWEDDAWVASLGPGV